MANLSKTTRDHEEIRSWAEARGGRPSCVKGTGDEGDIGILRIDFPGFSGEESLQEITWDEFFGKFDERNLSLLFQEETAGGERSNFNKLVSAETAAESEERAPGSAMAKKAGSKKAAKKAVKKTAAKSAPVKKSAKKSSVVKSSPKKAVKKAAAKKVVSKKTAAKKALKKAVKKQPAKSVAKKTVARKKAIKKIAKKAAKKVAAKKSSRRRRY